MRIAIAQIDPVVGAFEANVKKIKEAHQRASSKKSRILITPELSLCGYPPHDLMDRPEMVERNEKALEDLREFTQGKACALLVGHVAKTPSEFGRPSQNCVTILEDGKRVFRQAKTLLPTYDVFDEARYFEPAEEVKLYTCDGKKIAVAICEDLWAGDPAFGRRLYGRNPVEDYRAQGAALVLSVSASPYEWAKTAHRQELHAEVARTLRAPLVYLNQVGATDEILFDGASFALNADGSLIGRLPSFKTSFGLLEMDGGEGLFESPDATSREDDSPSEIEVLERALVTGIREYFSRTGFKTAILGLSGGIDSAVVAALAVQALGPKQVLGVAMPSQYSSSHSLEDAEILAKNLGIGFEVRPIKFQYSTLSREIADRRGELAPLALENLQSRLRGIILMTLANHYGALLFTTANKSELATGYCTLYGDMAGALAPLGDLFKTRVYDLATWINQAHGGVIPERTLTKAPSAELRPNQKDQDTLPPYEVLDRLLADYIQAGVSVAELEKRYGKPSGTPTGTLKPGWVSETLRRLEINEYKRRQAPPVLKVSPKAFGIGRRIPIAKIWDQ